MWPRGFEGSGDHLLPATCRAVPVWSRTFQVLISGRQRSRSRSVASDGLCVWTAYMKHRSAFNVDETRLSRSPKFNGIGAATVLGARNPDISAARQNPRAPAQVLLAASLILSLAVSTYASARLSGCFEAGARTLEFALSLAVLYGLTTLLFLLVCGEFRTRGLGDTPSRVIGAVEASILAWFPAVFILLLRSQASAGPLPEFIAWLGPLSVTLNALTVLTITSGLRSTGERIGLFYVDNIADEDLPKLPVGHHTITARIRINPDQPETAARAMATCVRHGHVDQVLIVAPPPTANDVLDVVRDLKMFDLPNWYAPQTAKRSRPSRCGTATALPSPASCRTTSRTRWPRSRGSATSRSSGRCSAPPITGATSRNW